MSRDKKPFVSQLYRNAPRRTKKGFIDHIHGFEKERGNPISLHRAEEIFRILVQQSRTAEKEGRKDEIWISYDFTSGEWGGYETQFKVYGIDGRVKSGGYRDKFGKIYPMSKEEVLDEIITVEKCGMDKAKRIFDVCKANGYLIYDRKWNTRTWYGIDCLDMPTQADIVERPPTRNQLYYRERYGMMPSVKHNYFEPEKSEHLTWLITRERELGVEIDLIQAEKTRMRVWNCSKPPWKKENGRSVGIDYVEPFTLTDAQINEIEDMRGCWSDVFESRISEVLSIKGDRIKAALVEIGRLGLTVRFPHSQIEKDGTTKKGEVVGGKRWHEELLAEREAAAKAKEKATAEKEAAAAAAKAEQERASAEAKAERERKIIELAATKLAEIRKAEQDEVSRKAAEQAAVAAEQKRLHEKAESLRPFAEQFASELGYGEEIGKSDAIAMVRSKFPDGDHKGILTAAKTLGLVDYFPEFDQPFYRRTYEGFLLKFPDGSSMTFDRFDNSPRHNEQSRQAEHYCIV